MKMLKFAAAAALVAASSTSAFAVQSFQTGNALLRDCTAKNSINQSFCLGYIEGVVDALETLRSVNGAAPCTGNGVEGGQVMDVVVKSLREHPEGRNSAAGALVVAAIAKAFCPGDS